MERFYYSCNLTSFYKIFLIIFNLIISFKSFAIKDDCNFICQKATSIQNNITFYGSISGGYSRLQGAYRSTGQSGLYRIALGSFYDLNKSMKLGSELGFQNGSQMLLTSKSTNILGENILPITLFTASPIDILGTIRIEPYKMFFFEIKGGAAHQNISINGADVNTNYVWLPEIQFSSGLLLFSKNRLSITYQRFFGKYPKLVNLNEETWESTLNGAPIMQAVFLTAAINL